MKDRPDLLCDRLYEKEYKDVKAILEISEWREKKFVSLLTSIIWNSNFKDIITILHMPEWNDKRFLKRVL